MKNTCVIILAGGSGKRLWPASFSSHPKQFLDLLGTGETLLQSTYYRFEKICPSENILVVTNQRYEELIREQLPQLEENQLAIEPQQKNTATCVLYAVNKLAEKHTDNPNVIIAPSDHVIPEPKEFKKFLRSSVKWVAKNNEFLIVGKKPLRPDENYTYVQYREEGSEAPIFPVKTFANRPTTEIAETFLESGDFLWSTGILLSPLNKILEKFEEILPDLHSMFAEGAGLYNTPGERTFINHIYPICENTPIKEDFLFKLTDLKVAIASFKWSNLNNWHSLWASLEKDYMDNAVNGDKVLMYDSANCVVHVPNNKLVILEGLEGYIVADSKNALLVARRESQNRLRDLRNIIKRNNEEKYL